MVVKPYRGGKKTMDAPQSLEEAQALLDRFAKHQAAKSRFVRSMMVGRDGKPLPDWDTISDYWTGRRAIRRRPDAPSGTPVVRALESA